MNAINYDSVNYTTSSEFKAYARFELTVYLTGSLIFSDELG